MSAILIIVLGILVVALVAWRVAFGLRSVRRMRENPDARRGVAPGAWVVIGVLLALVIVFLIVQAVR